MGVPAQALPQLAEMAVELGTGIVGRHPERPRKPQHEKRRNRQAGGVECEEAPERDVAGHRMNAAGEPDQLDRLGDDEHGEGDGEKEGEEEESSGDGSSHDGSGQGGGSDGPRSKDGARARSGRRVRGRGYPRMHSPHLFPADAA